MLHSRLMVRRLLLEQLAERLTFDADGHLHGEEPLYTPDGLAYYYDPPTEFTTGDDRDGRWSDVQPKTDGPLQSDDGFQLMDSPMELNVPIYQSNPSFPRKLYLDFDGHVASGTHWNNQNYTGSYNTGATLTAPAFSIDTDLNTFSATELARIQEVWARVAEDYAPFQIDVTTQAPPASLFTAGSQAMRIVISTDIDAVTGVQWYPNAGGVAYLNSWTYTNGTPAWVFANRLGNSAKNIAEAASHEGGHTFNLGHDGRTSPAEGYYRGHGSGATSWAPIMGVGYSRTLTQWSRGEYANANNTQDDLAIISSRIPYIADDHGNTVALATQLNVGTASTLAASGLITTRTDVDAFRFATQAGTITLDVAPFDYTTGKNNLDSSLTLLNSLGATVASVDNVNVTNSTLTVSVAKGFYTLVVDGVGRPAITGDEGYSDYGSLGKYSISGTIVPNAAPTVVNDNATVVPQGSVLVDVMANDSDANNDTLVLLSIGSPAVGTAVIEAGKIRYTASSALGTVTIAYTVRDELGVTASGLATIVVNTPPTDIGLSANTVTENVAGGIIGNLSVVDADAGDSHLLTVDDNRFEIVSGVLRLKPGSSLNFEAAATINVTVTARDAAGAQISKSFSINVSDLPEMAGSGLSLGDGSGQRSALNQLTVTFDGVVTIDSGAFAVLKRGSEGGVVSTNAAISTNGAGQTVVLLTFSGQFTRDSIGSLSDGYYQLNIDGTKISRGGQLLDANGDGQGGDSYTFGANEADNFFALFGDTNGDGLVGIAEFGQFRDAFGKTMGQQGYNPLFDFDADGAVGIADFGQFRSRFGKAKMIFP